MASKLRHSQEFIEKELKKEGYQLLSNYVNAKTKIKIKCPQGHKYEVTWSNFKQGNRCPRCRAEKMSEQQRLSSTFIKEEMLKDGYILLSEYKHSATKVDIECPEGHQYQVTWANFQQGYRCPKCSAKKRGCQLRHSQMSIKTEMKKEGYLLLSEYFGAHIKIEVQCPKGHKYLTTWHQFQMKQRCIYCRNKTEQVFREVIEKAFNSKFPKKRPQWLINPQTNYPLELDGYNEELGLAFEYQGIQHFEKVAYFKDTKERFAKRQSHDKIKKKLCKQNNVTLLCPTYKLNESDFEAFIIDALKDTNFDIKGN